MKKIISIKGLLILPIVFSVIFITNCTSDQNMTGYTESPSQSVSKIYKTDFAIEELNSEVSTITIQVSPNILNLQNNGVVATIHADIPYSIVSASSVSLNGIEIQSWKADSQGFFVAKFNLDEVKTLADLKIGDYNTLTLTGESINGAFTGSEAILVISKTGK